MGVGGWGAQKSLAPLEVWWLVVATQDGGPALALLGWPPGCFLVASLARSQAIMLLEPWRDGECSGDSSTVAMNGTVDFPKKKLAHQ